MADANKVAQGEIKRMGKTEIVMLTERVKDRLGYPADFHPTRTACPSSDGEPIIPLDSIEQNIRIAQFIRATVKASLIELGFVDPANDPLRDNVASGLSTWETNE
jgi:hypothetical protein